MKDFLKKLSPFESKCYILIVGDRVATLLFADNNNILAHHTGKLSQPQDKQRFLEILDICGEAPIRFYNDAMEVSCVQHTLPGVSPLSVRKIVQKRLEKECKQDELKGALPVGRQTTGRKDWQYIFITSPVTPIMQEWIDLLNESQHPIASIQFLPVAMQQVIPALQKALFTKRDKTALPWQLYVFYNASGSYRQVVLKNNKLVFTRITQEHEGDTVESTSFNLTQDILNTVEYLHRLSLEENQSIDIILICPDTIKSSFASDTLSGHNFIAITADEFGGLLASDIATADGFKHTDLVIGSNLANAKATLALQTPQTRKRALLYQSQQSVMLAALSITPLLLLFAGFQFILLFGNYQAAGDKQLRNQAILQQWNALSIPTGSIDNVTNINDRVALYKALTHNVLSPLPLIEKFDTAIGENALVKYFSWNTQGSQIGKRKRRASKHKGAYASFEVEFINNKDSFESLFNSFDQFILRLEKHFPDYNMEYSRIDQKITFNEHTKIIPVQVSLIGPKKSKKR